MARAEPGAITAGNRVRRKRDSILCAAMYQLRQKPHGSLQEGLGQEIDRADTTKEGGSSAPPKSPVGSSCSPDSLDIKNNSPPQTTTHRPLQIAQALLSEADFNTLQKNPQIHQQTTPIQGNQTPTTSQTDSKTYGHIQSIFLARRSV